MARTLELDTITEPNNSGTANITLSSNTTTTMPLVDINGGAIDATAIGAGTPSSVAATTLSTTSNATVGGTLGVTGVTTLDGNVTLGNASGDTITVTGTMSGFNNKSGMTGEVRMWAGSSAPTGWLFCDGAAVSRSTYSALFGITSTAFGIGDGSSTFNVPDMKGRMPVGVGTGTGGGAEDADGSTVPSGGAALVARSLGEWSGSEVLSTAQLAAHTHTSAGHTHTGPSHTHTVSHNHSASSNTTGNHNHTLSQTHLGGPDPVVTNRVKVGGQLNYGTAPLNDAGNHSHSITVDTANPTTSASGTGNTGSTTPGATGSTGSGSKFTPPIMCINFIIKT